MWKLTRDAKLGFLRVKNPPTQPQLDTYYEEKYFQARSGNYKAGYTAEELRSFELTVKRALRAIDFDQMSARPKSLDLGCGEGFASRTLRQVGFDVMLVDQSSAGLELHNPELLDSFVQSDVQRFLSNTNSQWELIWVSHVLEHVIDPEGLLDKLRDSLSPNGRAVITVPNDDSDFQRFLKKGGYVSHDWWIAPPEHLTFFNVETFQRLAEHQGFLVETIIASLPIDWALLNPKSNYVSNPEQGTYAHSAVLALEEFLGTVDFNLELEFRKSLAAIGLGRNLTFVLKKSILR